MKKICLILWSLFLLSCDNEDAWDCIQAQGQRITTQITVPNFERILVNRDISLEISEAITPKVFIETGENLINEVSAEVIDNQLILTDNNRCNFVRDFGITKVYVEAPNLTEIISSTQYTISSRGTLNFSNLSLISEDFFGVSEFVVGDFDLTINSESVTINSNGLSFFYLRGIAQNISVAFNSGDGRFQGEDLIAQHINIFHRGTNDMVVNPQQSLSGELRSTGNIISHHMPNEVDVVQFFTGQLFFSN